MGSCACTFVQSFQQILSMHDCRIHNPCSHYNHAALSGEKQKEIHKKSIYTKRMLITEKCTLERIVKKYLYMIVHAEFIYIHFANVYKPFAHMHIWVDINS